MDTPENDEGHDDTTSERRVQHPNHTTLESSPRCALVLVVLPEGESSLYYR